MIPRVVPRGQLEAAMGIFNLTLQASFAVGFAFLGPLLVAVSGPSSVLIVVTVLYVAATVACLGLPSTERAPAPSGLAGRAVHEAVAQFREGLAAIHGDREVARPLLHLAAAATIVGVLGVLGPAIASSIGLEPNQLVVVVLPLGLGVVAGVFGLRRLGGGLSRRRAAEGGLTVFGLLIVAIALARPLLAALAPGARPEDVLVPVVVVLAFFSGSAYAATSVSAQTALFEHMPAEVRGRVFGVLATIVSAASLIPILIVGPLADLVSAAVVMAFVGAAVVVTAFLSAAASDGPRRPTA